jgi:transcriptional regulator with XRE-family HTH domain
MRESLESLKEQFQDKDYRYGYAESFLNSYIAAQIKIIREQQKMTQAQLAEKIGTKQAGISRLENVNYTAWKVETLTRLARAFDLRLQISFEEFGTLPGEVNRFGRESLERSEYNKDPVFGVVPERVEKATVLTKGEIAALSPRSEAIVIPISKALSAGEAYARDVDSPSKIPSLYGTRGVEPQRENVPTGPSASIERKISVPEQQQYRQG